MNIEHAQAAPDDAAFEGELRKLVASQVPRLFAVCEEIGVREDGFVRYWGLDFGEGAELISAEDGGRARARFGSVESARSYLSRHGKIHLIWADSLPGR
ncbi:hypothetical protein ACL03H_23790 [Saccharopolyspora sp. MS10]|uniref:hypothetical protein n=1 Tax=Saccharopolyspora sp. MS10 TaxID=3385973 RepID=UPI00399FEB97